MDVIIAIVILVGLLVLGVPVAFCFAGSILWMIAFHNYDPGFLMLCGFHLMSSVILLALPLFILFGKIVERGGIADKLVAFINSIVGTVKGGLGVVTILASGFFGAMSGSSTPSVCAIGTIMIPRMEREGYSRGYAAALVSASAVLSLLIPPSAMQILYGFITQTSIAACFLAIVGPGILMIVLFSIINVVLTRSMQLSTIEKLNRKESIKRVGRTGFSALPALSLPTIILGGIYGGIFTPSEAAAVAVFAAIFVGFFAYRSLKIRLLMQAVKDSAITTGTVMVLIFLAVILGRTFIMGNVPQRIGALMLSISTNKYVLLLLINLFLLALGMIMDDASACILAAPLLFPLIQQIGVSPVHFASIIGVNLGMGNVTPPVAPILYLGSRIGDVPLQKMLRSSFIFIAFGYLPGVFITTYWAELSLYLPRLLGYV